MVNKKNSSFYKTVRGTIGKSLNSSSAWFQTGAHKRSKICCLMAGYHDPRIVQIEPVQPESLHMCKRTVVLVLLLLSTEYRRLENAFYVYHLSFFIRFFGYCSKIEFFSFNAYIRYGLLFILCQI